MALCILAARAVAAQAFAPAVGVDRAGQPVYAGGRLVAVGRYRDALSRRGPTILHSHGDLGHKRRGWSAKPVPPIAWFSRVLVSLCVCSMYTSIASAIAWSAECTEGSPVEYRKIMEGRFAEVDQRLRSYVYMMR